MSVSNEVPGSFRGSTKKKTVSHKELGMFICFGLGYEKRGKKKMIPQKSEPQLLPHTNLGLKFTLIVRFMKTTC